MREVLTSLKMMLIIVFALLLSALPSSPIVAQAAARDAQVGVTRSESYANQSSDYQNEKKDLMTALVRGAVWPSWGTSYAGDKGRGTAPSILMGAGYGLMFLGLAKTSPSAVTVGFLSTSVASAWGAIASSNAAEEYNERLRSRLAIR